MDEAITPQAETAGRAKFLVGGLLIIAAIIYLIITSTQTSAQYFLTVEELLAKGDEIIGRDVRISGAVIGDTIHYDPQNLTSTFTVADVPGSNKEIERQGGLAKVLHDAVTDPNRSRLQVVYANKPKPDLLRDEAQAIMIGQLAEDGVFYADEVLLKCPTKYEEAVPEQVGG